MAGYKCTKCGILGNSKCAGQRSMFLMGADTPDGRLQEMIASSIGNVLSYGKTKHANTHVPTLEVALYAASYPTMRELTQEERDAGKAAAEAAGTKFDYWQRVPIVQERDWEKDQAAREAAAFDFLNHIRTVSEETLKRALCAHDWELTSARCELGCCKRTRKSRVKEALQADLAAASKPE